MLVLSVLAEGVYLRVLLPTEKKGLDEYQDSLLVFPRSVYKTRETLKNMIVWQNCCTALHLVDEMKERHRSRKRDHNHGHAYAYHTASQKWCSATAIVGTTGSSNINFMGGAGGGGRWQKVVRFDVRTPNLSYLVHTRCLVPETEGHGEHGGRNPRNLHTLSQSSP